MCEAHDRMAPTCCITPRTLHKNLTPETLDKGGVALRLKATYAIEHKLDYVVTRAP